MRSLPLTFLGAVLLGLFDNYVIGYAPQSWTWLSQCRPRGADDLPFRGPASSPPGPAPRHRSPGGRRRSARGQTRSIARWAAGPWSCWRSWPQCFSPGTLLTTVSTGLVFGIVALSLVLLTGYAGQVSLCQLTFVGIGSFAMGHIAGGGSWLGVLAAIGVGAATGVVVALPTLRLRGLYLALATLAFAQGAVTIFFFPEVDTHRDLKINDLNFFGLSLQSVPDQTVIYGCLFAIASMLVLAVRRGRLGRRLVGLSDSPAACATVGLDVKLTRLGVFAASAGLAGLAGALYGGTYVTSINFMLFTSLELLLLLVIWGVRSVAGALFAGISLSALTLLSSNSGLAGQLPFLLTGAGIVMIGWVPNGILGIGWFNRESAVRRAIDARSRWPGRTPAPVGTSADAA